MNVSRSNRASILALLVITLAPTLAPAADGVIDLTWGGCGPLISEISISPPAGQVFLNAFVLGNDTAHKGYQVQFTLSDPNDSVPDAWRFDAGGCYGTPFLEIRHVASMKSCPNFQGNLGSSQFKDYSFMPPGEGLPTTIMRGVLINAYPNGAVANPNLRYFLAQFMFDHTYSVFGPTTPDVNCGGVESPIIVRLLTGSYIVRDTGEERAFLPGNTVLGVNGAVPADRTTWGQIKSSYLR